MSLLTSYFGEWMSSLTPGEKLSRRAWASIKYMPKGSTTETDISDDIKQYLLSIDYTDNMTDQVDDVTVTLEDRAQLWQSSWFPEPGAKLDITIYTYNNETLSDGMKTLSIGQFEIDEIEIKSAPSVVQIKAVSASSEGGLRGEKKNRTWENISIWKCANDIAWENGLDLDWFCEDNPNLDHVEQSDESDLEFLRKVVKDAGFCLKIDAKKIIIFDEEKQEKEEAKIKFIRPGTQLETSEKGMQYVQQLFSYSLKAKTRDVYKACHVKYQKGKDKEIIEATYNAPDKKDGKVLECNDQVKDLAEAERMAKKKLREQNKNEVTCSFSVMGAFYYAAGVLVELKNFGKFDGKYIITKVSHKMGSGYTVDLDLRRCLNGY